jgi:hypothetical protein
MFDILTSLFIIAIVIMIIGMIVPTVSFVVVIEAVLRRRKKTQDETPEYDPELEDCAENHSLCEHNEIQEFCTECEILLDHQREANDDQDDHYEYGIIPITVLWAQYHADEQAAWEADDLACEQYGQQEGYCCCKKCLRD